MYYLVITANLVFLWGMDNGLNKPKYGSLLTGVNRREADAFGELYSILFNEIHYYSIKIYRDTEIDPGDAVQDVFLQLWQSGVNNFNSLAGVKSYLFVSLQNGFRKYIRKNETKGRFLDHTRNELEKFEADIYETEIYSIFHHVMNVLPEETAMVFQLFFKGWSADEIAEHLGKSKQTVYNIKSQALAILREKLSRDAMLILMALISHTN